MRVLVVVSRVMEIEDRVFKELHDLHVEDTDGTTEQYEKAISAVEAATGVKFLDVDKEGIENAEFRITDVLCADDHIPILEA